MPPKRQTQGDKKPRRPRDPHDRFGRDDLRGTEVFFYHNQLDVGVNGPADLHPSSDSDGSLDTRGLAACYDGVAYLRGKSGQPGYRNQRAIALADLENSDVVFDYTVERGDTLSGLARRFGTTTKKILHFNPQLSNPSYLRAGAIINMPKS